MSVSFQETSSSLTIGSFMDASRLTAQQHGLQPDERALEQDWNALTKATNVAGLQGEMYLDIPYAVRNTQQLIDGASCAAGKVVAEIWFPELWVPGRNSGGYTHEQLAKGSAMSGAVRMAVFGNNKNEPLLHFLGQPFDKKHARAGEVTQLDGIASWAESLKLLDPNLQTEALSVRGVLLIAQNRRNMPGETRLPMEWGNMRDGTLPRATVDDDSYVGIVNSGQGQSSFAHGDGDAYADSGVGLSVVLKQALSLEI